MEKIKARLGQELVWVGVIAKSDNGDLIGVLMNSSVLYPHYQWGTFVYVQNVRGELFVTKPVSGVPNIRGWRVVD